jgi:hypothetical protein
LDAQFLKTGKEGNLSLTGFHQKSSPYSFFLVSIFEILFGNVVKMRHIERINCQLIWNMTAILTWNR